jgi:hypothetical protein
VPPRASWSPVTIANFCLSRKQDCSSQATHLDGLQELATLRITMSAEFSYVSFQTQDSVRLLLTLDNIT